MVENMTQSSNTLFGRFLVPTTTAIVAYLLLQEQLARSELVAGCAYLKFLKLPILLPFHQFALCSG